MKNRNLKRVTYAILSIIGIFVVGLFGMLVLAAICGAGGVTYAMAAGTVPDQTVTTEQAMDVSPDLLRPDISKKITKIMPAAAPLDTLIREAGAHEKTGSLDFKFYSSELRPFEDTLAQLFTRPASLPSDSVYEITVTSGKIWQVDDDIIFHDTDGEDGLPLVAHIVGKSSDTLEVIFLNGGDEAGQQEGSVPPATIDDETGIGRLGNAKAELDAQTDPYGHLPTDRWNYVQQHMAQVEESLWQKVHNKEVDWDIRDMQTLSLFDLRCKMEATSWFGVRRKVFDPRGDDYKYHSGGVIRFIDRMINMPNVVITDPIWAAWTKEIFVGNAGSDRRYMFNGSDLNVRLSDVPHISKQIDGKSTEVVFGLTFNKIETNFGILLMRHHPLFNYHGFKDAGVVLDLNNIRKRVFDPMRVRKVDLMVTGIKRANAYVLEENFGLETRYADTHAIMTPEAVGS